jgi:protein tyrosine/serine phosphatase
MMDYIQISPLASEANVDAILNKIHETIQDYQHGPIYLHCWNGWHASGYISALALKQFCGTTDEAAVQYWDKNTDGQNKIRAFIPRQKFNISSDIQKNICPTL